MLLLSRSDILKNLYIYGDDFCQRGTARNGSKLSYVTVSTEKTMIKAVPFYLNGYQCSANTVPVLIDDALQMTISFVFWVNISSLQVANFSDASGRVIL